MTTRERHRTHEAPTGKPPAEASRQHDSSTDGRGGTLRRFGARVASALLTLLAVAGILTALIGVGTKVDVLKPLVVTSGSMEPTIPVGSLVFGRRIAAQDIEIGDVVTTPKSNGGLVTHRVVEIAEDPSDPDVRILTLRGDANSANDGQPYYVSSAFTPLFGAIPHAGVFLARMSEPPTPYIAGATFLLIIACLAYRPAPTGGSRHRADGPASRTRAAKGERDAAPAPAVDADEPVALAAEDE